jgi:hypothetical protein
MMPTVIEEEENHLSNKKIPLKHSDAYTKGGKKGGSSKKKEHFIHENG